jgi:hypothetical protein
MSKSADSYRIIVALVVLVASSAPALAQWRSGNFPPPNGGVLVYQDIGGNPACATYDGRNCLWGKTQDDIDFSRVKPLVCGAEHRTVWGVTGYEDPNHWCNKAKHM